MYTAKDVSEQRRAIVEGRNIVTSGIRQLVLLSLALPVFMLMPTRVAAQSLEDALDACLVIAEEQERLACFEELARRGDASNAVRDDSLARPAPRSSAPPDAAKTTPPPKDRFGLPEEKEQNPSEETRREMTLVEARKIPGNKGVYFMENGQVWTLVSGSYYPAKAGSKVVIEEALFGSYRMAIDNRWYRVRRLR